MLELPPRARRILTCSGEVRGVKGTTSACAENTFGAVFLINIIGNYLRVRGEYTTTAGASASGLELPPRARRILPCAESGYAQPWNYLHVRGEYYS